MGTLNNRMTEAEERISELVNTTSKKAQTVRNLEEELTELRNHPRIK